MSSTPTCSRHGCILWYSVSGILSLHPCQYVSNFVIIAIHTPNVFKAHKIESRVFRGKVLSVQVGLVWESTKAQTFSGLSLPRWGVGVGVLF